MKEADGRYMSDQAMVLVAGILLENEKCREIIGVDSEQAGGIIQIMDEKLRNGQLEGGKYRKFQVIDYIGAEVDKGQIIGMSVEEMAVLDAYDLIKRIMSGDTNKERKGVTDRNLTPQPVSDEVKIKIEPQNEVKESGQSREEKIAKMDPRITNRCVYTICIMLVEDVRMEGVESVEEAVGKMERWKETMIAEHKRKNEEIKRRIQNGQGVTEDETREQESLMYKIKLNNTCLLVARDYLTNPERYGEITGALHEGSRIRKISNRIERDNATGAAVQRYRDKLNNM